MLKILDDNKKTNKSNKIKKLKSYHHLKKKKNSDNDFDDNCVESAFIKTLIPFFNESVDSTR